MAENKKPLSLNERHNRILQDLSASHSRHPESRPSKVKIEGRRRLCKAYREEEEKNIDYEDDLPRFSGIADFDSPLPGEGKQSKYSDLEDEEIPSKAAQKDEEYPSKAEQKGTQKKPPLILHTMMKIEGRRRLCKASTKFDQEESSVVDDIPGFELCDFESTPKTTITSKNDNGCGNEIRDILSDLSSRLELLSIEKNRISKPVDPVADTSSALFKEEFNQQKKDDLPEYATAGSSFSLKLDTSDSSSDAATESKVGHKYDTMANSYTELEKMQSEAKGKVKHLETVSEKLPTLSKFVEEDTDDDGHRETDGFQSEAKGNNLVDQVKTLKIDNEKRAVYSKFADEDINDDSDDCVILSGNGKKSGKKDANHDSQFEDRSDNTEKDEMLKDISKNLVWEEEKTITLKGPTYTYRLPGKIAEMLFPHQRDGLKWLWSLHCQGKGGILGDDMGLGKTMQICGFLAGLFNSRLVKRVMVVAPKTLLSHWVKELTVVGLSDKIREYYGTCAKARQYELQYVLQDKGVLLTTYDIVRNNSKSLRGDYYFREECSEDIPIWDYMILDEGHLIKNPSTQRAKSLLEISCAHRIIISGTPLQNNLKELWALFNFCCPNLLGDKNGFKQRYEVPILRGNDKNATEREKRIGSAVAKELREWIQPYFLRRLKSEIFRENDSTTSGLSKKNEIIVWLRLTHCQRQLYEAFLKSELVFSAFDGSPLAALTILKKICDHPFLLTKRAAEDVLEGLDTMLNQEERDVAEKLAMHIADAHDRVALQKSYDNVSCKLSFILSLLDNLIPEGHSVLIFSQTRKMLDLIQDSLLSKGYDYLRIDGTTKANDRAKIVNDFQEGIGASIFLLTSQVGGLGLTLTKADRVIVVDPAWNPSTDNQSVDRAYRIGQKKDVIVYRLMTSGTVEEKIYRKQDLRELFSLPKQGFDISLTQKQLQEEHGDQHLMDKSLKAHIMFLESQGIAGVSNHSLLFSKAAPVPVEEEEQQQSKRKETAYVSKHSSRSSLERDVDGAEYAYNPKDVKVHNKLSSSKGVEKSPESDIKDRINRLTQIFADKATISRLPDKGERIKKQIVELNMELVKIRMEKISAKGVIDLDELTDKLQRSLNV
ncbi:Helicase, C-terminal [Dillenia turbinata]|uniref:Helicase, C-terminal n=1 Tax=Dillenia turbinata TaxID=194707 RepID=A0AAN8UVR7_9MAGN